MTDYACPVSGLAELIGCAWRISYSLSNEEHRESSSHSHDAA